jgi:hypothetical protein
MFVRIALKLALVAATAAFVWSVIARPSGAHGDKQVYVVRRYDTLWTIASSHYAGDARDAVWRIERTNQLRGPTIRTGERLVLP